VCWVEALIVYTFANPIRRAHQDIECVGLDQGLKNSGERVRVRARWRNPAEQLPHEFVWELFELLPDLQLHPLPRSAPTWLQEPRRSLPPLLGPPRHSLYNYSVRKRFPRKGGPVCAPCINSTPCGRNWQAQWKNEPRLWVGVPSS
jgi:hypothetical protein